MNVAERIRDLSRNLYWAWHPDFIRVFRDIQPDPWREVNHNPVEFLQRLAYAYGYFDQSLDAGGWQQERYFSSDEAILPWKRSRTSTASPRESRPARSPTRSGSASGGCRSGVIYCCCSITRLAATSPPREV